MKFLDKVCYNEFIMEGNKNKPRALMIFGAPGSGKTTFGEKFAHKFGLAYLNLDEVEEQNGFTRDQIFAILELLTRTRQTIVFEGCMDSEAERIELRNLLRSVGYEPSLIWLQTDVATLRTRLKAKYRSVKKAKDVYNTAIKLLEAPAESEHPIILSGKHTFETQTKHVIAGLAEQIDTK